MAIEFHRYTLEYYNPINRFGDLKKDGVHFRVDGKNYVDYFSWEQFGDLSVDDMIEKVKHDKTLPDFLLSNLCLDKAKNQINHDSFLNHSLLMTKNGHDNSVVKIKYMSDMKILLDTLEEVRTATIRIDFNNALSFDETIQFWNHLDRTTRQRVEFLEDPFELTEEEFQKLLKVGIPIAADRNNFVKGMKWKIYKPNVELEPQERTNIIYSSYMGDDLGRYHCYLALMENGDKKLYHGVDTPELFKGQKQLFCLEKGRTKINKDAVADMYRDLEDYSWQYLI